VIAIQEQDWLELGFLFNEQQKCMKSLGVSDDHLDSLIAELRAQPNILGAKISGSGLGDCVIGVSSSGHTISKLVIPAQAGIQATIIPTRISLEGLRYE
jgi:mevalonate kinase